ncbi:hypothetical protein SADUNF_Sadunf06G0217500 [Salix dunnii]|uniref:Uncharacterized protein n=1 Tax=Salix dunnii TaxID=1413687 RepID=A0A835K621_9ROSI|nr:hypothetical protein SADUNF_Sadunf06G0217500 [Salix dunnii]
MENAVKLLEGQNPLLYPFLGCVACYRITYSHGVQEREASKGVRKNYRFNDNQNLDKTLPVHKTSVPLEREKHRTAYVSPCSRVFGRGELVIVSLKLIARRYLRPDFFIDLVAALPLPQPSGIHLFKARDKVWSLSPKLVTKNMRLDMVHMAVYCDMVCYPRAGRSSVSDHTNNALVLIVLLQYIPRLYLIFPSSSEIIKSTRVITETAWAGAAYNLLLYMLASHARNASLNREIHAILGYIYTPFVLSKCYCCCWPLSFALF